VNGKYVIRIYWGYWMLYAQQPFHHVDYCWDGQVRVDKGQVFHCWLIEFHGLAGPCKEKLVPLYKPSWHWHAPRANNRLGGVVVEIEGGLETMVHLSTRTTDMKFSIKDILKKKLIRRHVGSRYSCVNVTALLDGYDPNLDGPEDIAAMIEADGRWRKLIHARDFRGQLHRWHRTDWVWSVPGKSMKVDIEAPHWKQIEEGVEQSLRAIFRCIAAVPGREDKYELPERERGSILPYRVFLNDQEVANQEQYFGSMSHNIPLMEELVVEIPEALLHAGTNTLRLQNDDNRFYILVARLYLEEIKKRNFEVTVCPNWVTLREEFEVVVLCRSTQHDIRVEMPPGIMLLDKVPNELGSGEHRFRFRAKESLADIKIRFESNKGICEAYIEQVVAQKQENFPMRVGLEDKILPPDSPGLRENVLRYLKNTQLGNFMIFRRAQSKDQMIRWARLCQKYGIYYEIAWSINGSWASEARREAEEYFTGYQWTEHDGPIFGYLINPKLIKLSVPEGQRTMRTAYEDYLAYMRRLVTITRQIDPEMQAVAMISVIGHSLAYQADMDRCEAQLNKTHNVLLLADARGAARAHGKSIWGSYIAEGAHVNPTGEEHLRMWWLALHLSYICGASFVNDEETLLRTWHERLYAWGDRFPLTRQRILRNFNRYVKTHPRRGRIQVKQALLIGRYACDVADGIADSKHEGILPMVWRNFGANTPQWRPLTPEYGLRYLDVFFPGIWLQSLIQSPERIRRWYSGTPYGELELISIEAPENILQQFSLLLLLGWNTMNETTYESLKKYVQHGGRIFMSVPHLTINESRTFLLNNMEPLNLLRKGDFSDLFGVKIMGRGERLNCIKAVDGVKQNPVEGVEQFFFEREAYPAVGPKHPPVYLTKTQLCGAEVLAYDEKTDQPLLVRYHLGQGEAYLLLTYDFPGNSWLSGFMTDLIHGLFMALLK